MTPRFISGSVPPRDKIPKAIPMFSRVSFSTVPMLTLSCDSFTSKFEIVRCPTVHFPAAVLEILVEISEISFQHF